MYTSGWSSKLWLWSHAPVSIFITGLSYDYARHMSIQEGYYSGKLWLWSSYEHTRMVIAAVSYDYYRRMNTPGWSL